MLSRINNKKYPVRADFIKHLRENKLSLKEYCLKYYDKRDLLTGEPIEYKDDVHYIHSFFNSRENLVNYFVGGKGGESELKLVLGARKEMKGLQFAPSTSESRTCILPSPALVSKLGYNYNEICSEIGLRARYNYDVNIERVSEPIHILVDTREQNPLPLSCRVSTAKLDVGDYSCQNHFSGCFVERKSLEDFCGTMSQGYERFKNEIGRAEQLGFHLAVVVEEALETILQINIANTHRFIKGSPEFYFARMRALCEQHSNIQFLFVAGRYKSAKVIEELFKIKGGFSSLDLQFLCDNKKI